MWCVECVFYLVYKPLRAVLSRYAVCGNHFLRAVDGLVALGARFGRFFEKTGFCVMGDVPRLLAESAWSYIKRRLKNTSLNTLIALARTNTSITNQTTRFVRWLSQCSLIQLKFSIWIDISFDQRRLGVHYGFHVDSK